ncbi:MAG: hypoxanthine phosphoribosyltransferase [Paludibacteraceae bacterium]|nr:hypoxanthine phosphoribosyltransferase [Paludibacteraceae bacterium]MBQ4018711.1 hypoxanthine phosphoribosyltransferase [Paludibacteraceae bacterium]MBQ5379127.1 hypoxanthine phosphoribosyltransferase [Paludibacteraceae bacterium]
MRTIDEQGYHFDEWLTPKEIAKDVQQVAKQISADYADKEPLFVVVLNGAFVFAADLLRALENVRCEVTFIRVSSYWGMSSTGQLEFIVPLQQVVDNRDVVIVEDIVDTGLTIHQLKAHLRGLGATSVRVASMLFKPNKLEYEDAKPDYVGHEITDEFVIGYGLDFDGFVRNLDAIYKVKE